MGSALPCRPIRSARCRCIAWLADLARRQQRIIPVRLVKGAYWDSEIKRGQELGLSDYPVFTRKIGDGCLLSRLRARAARCAAFDLSAIRHAQRPHARGHRGVRRRDSRTFEFQRLHGMGEALYELYDDVIEPSRKPWRRASTRRSAPTRICCPIWCAGLLENGANTSFVNRLANDEAPIEEMIADPVKRLEAARPRRNPRIAKPEALFPARRNSSGLMLSDPVTGKSLLSAMRWALGSHPQTAHPIINGGERVRETQACARSGRPARQTGEASEASDDDIRTRLDLAADAQASWDRRGGIMRADILERAADLFEDNRPLLMGLLVREAGRTVPNALSEVREAVDFLRYYAKEARANFSGARALPGPVGRAERADAVRPRRVHVHRAVEFSALDFHRAGCRLRLPRATACWPSPRSRRR